MKRYNDYKKDKSKNDLTKEELKNIDWVKYKIIVPSIEDKTELIKAFKHIHDSDVDTDNVVINQLSHEYLTADNIIVSEKNYNILNK